MTKVRIIADSTCDLSQDLIAKHHISIIPLNIVLETESYKDGIEITPEEIYKWSDKKEATPKTASPDLGYVIELLRPMAQAGEEIIFIGISEEMSVTCQVVRMAAEELEYDRIKVVNSMNLSTGIGLQVLKAAELSKQGKSLEEIVKELEDTRHRVSASFVIDNLTYLHRGGRCNSVTALLGNTLKLKPEIVVKNGKMAVGSKFRGKQQIVVKKYAESLREHLLTADSRRAFITHSGIDTEILEEIHHYVRSLNRFDEVIITQAGGVISSHCGPNTLGILFYRAE